jgi:hypothetical protein
MWFCASLAGYFLCLMEMPNSATCHKTGTFFMNACKKKLVIVNKMLKV